MTYGEFVTTSPEGKLTVRRLKFCVVPTHDRPVDFADCLAAIGPQVDHVVVVSHDASYAQVEWATKGISVVPYREYPPNISRMWNLGLDRVQWLSADEPYDVAILNDDAIVPPGWFTKITEGMRARGAVMGSAPRPGCPGMVSGFAFILDGGADLRADEQFHWWFGEDDLQRQAGGAALIHGVEVEHRHPSSTTVGVLAEIAGADQARYAAKWGSQ